MNDRLRDSRPVPDYTNRNTKLRLFAIVAALMLVLAVAERSRNPKLWQWLAGLGTSAANREAPNSRLPNRPPPSDPPGTLVMAGAPTLPDAPEIEPQERAWQQGWKDVYDHLQLEERDLLFELLGNAARKRALAPAKAEVAGDLVQRLKGLWEEYQAAELQSLGQLKDDDRKLWSAALRGAGGRFSGELLPAVQSLIDGRTPTEAEELALAGLSRTFAHLTLAQIQDDSVFRPAERDIWFQLLADVHQTPAGELAARSLGRVTYLQLFKQPADYRGKVVTVKGTAKLAYRVQAPSNYLGIKQYFVYWIQPESGPASPIVVYALDAPPGFREIKDKDLDRQTTKLREEVEVTGVFFKRWAYPAAEGTYTAPLIIAKAPAWRPASADLTAGPAGLSARELAAAALAALLLAACLTAVLWSRTRRRRRRADELAPSKIASLANLSLAPTPADSLREMERLAKSRGG